MPVVAITYRPARKTPRNKHRFYASHLLRAIRKRKGAI